MIFEDNKDVISVDEIEDENDDIAVTIDAELSLSKDTIFEDCNILIDVSAGGAIKTNGKKLKFVDSKICFKGSKAGTVIELKKGNCEIEECSIFQIDAKEGSFTRFLVSRGDGCIDISNCSFDNMEGRIIQTVGGSLFIEGCKVQSIQGEFCNVCYDEKKKTVYPSVSIKNTEFKDCSFPQKVDLKKTGKTEPKYWESDSPSIIDGNEIVSATFEGLRFEDCTLLCIRVKNTMLPNPCRLSNSEFINCKQSFDSENYCVYFRKTNLTMSKCAFKKSCSVYMHCQYSSADVKECTFDGCDLKSDFGRTGVLYILDEVDEPIIHVRNCKFSNCKVIGSDTAMIYITAGVPEKKQANTVIIEKCKYVKCKSEQDIRGTEKQGGFFGKTIKMYLEK